MAADEDTELRDLLIETLEKKGILGKIKAELRASVFLALEEQDDIRKKLLSSSQRAADSLSTEMGRIAATLVQDFLEYFDLKFTQSVFGCEAQFGRLGEAELRTALGISSGTDQPFLFHLISLIKTPAIDKQRHEESRHHAEVSRTEKGDHVFSNESADRSTLPGNKTYVIGLDGSPFQGASKGDIIPKLTNDGHSEPSSPLYREMDNPQPCLKVEMEAAKVVEPAVTPSALPSLTDLSLVTGFAKPVPLDIKEDDDPEQLPSEKRALKQDGNQGTGSSKNGSENTSIEEELEDITNIDDVLSSSLSLGDDMTADHTISQASNLDGCDYAEPFQNG